MGEGRTSVEQHLDRVLATVTPLSPVELPLAEAAGRTLAEDVTAELAVPRFDHAAMDGFAVRAAEVASALADRPVELPVAGSVAAGDEELAALEPGTALRIMTGAPVPPGADVVVPFEWTSGTDPVAIRRAAPAGRHIRRSGEDVAAGELVLEHGAHLRPAGLGLLAAVGRRTVRVHPRPRVAVLATGAELVSGEVPDSNSVTLAAAARQAGAEVTTFGPVGDDVPELRAEVVRAAAVADLVVTTGGVSAGDHDVVKAAFRDDPAFWFGPVAMKPGRPQGCGTVPAPDGRQVPVVTLPGTPVAAYTSFLLFALPALRALEGRGEELPEIRLARLGAPVQATDRTVLLPGVYDEDDCVVPLPGHAGHSQRLLARAEVLLVVPPGERMIDAGEILEVKFLEPWEE